MKINFSITNDFNHPIYLYGLNLKLSKEEIKKFEGIKYVLMQGSEERAKFLAKKIAKTIFNIDEQYFDVHNLTKMSAYSCYRIGNILSLSHGMGSSSMMTLLHDISKLMYFANNHDVEYIRIGTSGGIGISPGIVVLTNNTYMSNLEQGYKCSNLDKVVVYPTHMDANLNERIMRAQPKSLSFEVRQGNSIAADDFYLGQARFDGAIIPNYDEKKREQYFAKIKQLSILNMEMESAAFASFCNRAEIPATMIAVTIINRALGDQFSVPPEQLLEWSDRSHQVVMNYLLSDINLAL